MTRKPRVEDWHRHLARITGQMSLRITRRNLSKAEMDSWIKELEAIAKEMREFVSR